MAEASSATPPIERDVMQYDVVIVGAGPAGLACAIRLKQLKPDISVCVLEKAAAVGAHSLSGRGARAGAARAAAAGLAQRVSGHEGARRRDDFRILTRAAPSARAQLAGAAAAASMTCSTPFNNHGNFIISLGAADAVARRARPKHSASRCFQASPPPHRSSTSTAPSKACASATWDWTRTGSPAPTSPPGVGDPCAGSRCWPKAHAARSARSCISEVRPLPRATARRPMGSASRSCGSCRPGACSPGCIQHAFGWPLDRKTYGGSFLYHLDNDRVYVGYVVGLDYRDPRLQPFEAFQQFKNHPTRQAAAARAARSSRPARAPSPPAAGSRLPTLEMPGAMLIGDAGGTLNFPKIKGIHQAIRSGVLAAEHLAEAAAAARASMRAGAPPPAGRSSQACATSSPASSAACGSDWSTPRGRLLTGGTSPWTLKNTADWSRSSSKLDEFTSPERHWVERTLPPRDRVSSVFFAGNTHEENQPVHLQGGRHHRSAPSAARREFGNPCERFCPAGVYEMVDDGQGGRRLQINAANCVHCKACDIKDPVRASSPGPRPRAAPDRTTSRCSISTV